MIPLAKKNPIGPKSGADKPGIFDEDAVQPDNFIEGKGMFACLHHSAPPPLQSVSRRVPALDHKARAAVREQQKACGARDDMAAGTLDGIASLFRESSFREGNERGGSPNDRDKILRTKKVVADSVPF